jgi:hypothetical protein
MVFAYILIKKKGERKMEKIVQIGMFPGQINAYAVEVGTTVAEALELANIAVGNEQEIKMDGVVVSGDTAITENSNLIIITKRLKGALN